MDALHETMTKLFSEHQDQTSLVHTASRKPNLQIVGEEAARSPNFLNDASKGKDYLVP